MRRKRRHYQVIAICFLLCVSILVLFLEYDDVKISLDVTKHYLRSVNESLYANASIMPREAEMIHFPKKGFISVDSLVYTLSYGTVEPLVNPCSGNETDFLLLVHSALSHSNCRIRIRDAIPSNFGVVFILGRDEKGMIPREINREQLRYKDLLIGNFTDSYRNLTIKHLLGYSYVTTRCSFIKFIAKIDDDVFVNFDQLPHLMQKMYEPDEKAIYGITPDTRIQRNNGSKWYVSFEDLEGATYPDFCSGWFYITTPNVCKAILDTINLAEARNPFWIDDVWVTGFLRSLAHVARREIPVHGDETSLKKWTSINETCILPFLSVYAGEDDLLKSSYRKSNQLRGVCGNKCPLCHHEIV